MSKAMNSPVILLLVVLILASLSLGCSSNEPTSPSTIRVEDPRNEPFFTVTSTTKSRYFEDDEEVEVTTILFASPDLWKIVEPWQAIPTETIINGDRAWNIQRGESVPINGEPIRATALSFIGALPLLNQIQDKVEAHEGPSIAGEATTVYILEDPDFGERMQAIQENLPAFNVLPPEERQKLQEARVPVDDADLGPKPKC